MESSTINERHPDDGGDEAAAEAFFGDPDESVAAEEPEVATTDPEPDDAPESESEPDPEPDPTPAGDAGKTGSTGKAEPPAPEPEKNAGTSEREYIVFQRVPLTEKVLKHLLTAIEKGEAPTPRAAYFELHRATTRNDRQAIAEAYSANREALGDHCQLAAVSSRSFKERKVQPRIPVQRTDISIT